MNYMNKKQEVNFYISSYGLPKDGWLQVCVVCRSRITGILKYIRYLEGKKFTRVYQAYICKDCLNLVNKYEDQLYKFKLKCCKMISDFESTGKVKDKHVDYTFYEETNKNL